MPRPVYACTAQFTINKATVCMCETTNDSIKCYNSREMIRVQGCTKHSHDEEIRHQRVSQLVKDTLISLLKAGVPKTTILERYCSSNNYSNVKSKLITMQDLVNFERLYVDLEIDPKLSDFENICTTAERTEFRAISFDGRQHPPVPRQIQNKVVHTGGTYGLYCFC